MSIRFECGNCGRSYTVEDQLAGKTAKCKGCGQTLTIPQQQAPVSPTPSRVVEQEEILDISRFEVKPKVAPPVYAPAPYSAPRRAQGGIFDRYKSQWIVGACIAVVSGVAVGAILMFNKPAEKTSKKESIDNPGLTYNPAPDPELNPTPLSRRGLNPVPNPNTNTNAGDVAGVTPESAMSVAYALPDLPGENGAVVELTDPGSRQSFSARLLWPVKEGRVPLLVMPVSGTDGYVGADLTSVDMNEAKPFVEAGYAVMQFSLPGVPVRVGELEATRLFHLSRGGLVPARMAIELAIKSDHVDRDKIYVAARDSAGAVGVMIAGLDARIKGGMFFSPLVELKTTSGNASRTAFAGSYQPMNFLNRNLIQYKTKSLFVFHTETDSFISSSRLRNFVSLYQGPKNFVLLNQGERGEAYRKNGVPAALYWLKKQFDPSIADVPTVEVNGGRITSRNYSSNGVQYVVDGIPVNGARFIVSDPSVAQLPGGRTGVTKDVPPRAGGLAGTTDETVVLPGSGGTTVKTPAGGDNITLPGGAAAADPVPIPEPPKIILSDKDFRLRLQKAGAVLKMVGETMEIEGVDLRTVKDFNGAMDVLAEMSYLSMLQLTADQISQANLVKIQTIKHIDKLELANAKITDEKIDLLGKFPPIEELNLSGNAGITSRCAKAIATLTNVKKLNLSQTKIDNSVCPSLAKLTNLKTLDISGSSIDSAGIRQLKPLKDLAGLKINGLDVSAAAVKDLQAALIKCNIIQ